MNTHTITLANGWVASFENQGEFRMSAESWNLVLHGPDQRTLRYFDDQIVLVNDEDGTQASSCIACRATAYMATWALRWATAG